MRNYLNLALVAAVAVGVMGCDPKAGEQAAAPAAVEPNFASDEAKVSYGMGRSVAIQLNQGGFETDRAAFVAGFDDQLSGADPRVSEAEFTAARGVIMERMQAQAEAEMKVMGEANAKAAAEFLAANATKEGVQTTESGLQYKVLEEGEGKMPAATDTVIVHYRGTLLDGTEFDSSHTRGQPATFPVNAVIPGWTEALQLMKVGAKWEIYLPPELAYGPGGTAGIPPNSALIFEVDLVGVAEPVAPAQVEITPLEE